MTTTPGEYIAMVGICILVAIGLLWLFLWSAGVVEAAEVVDIPCPNKQPCKVITISPAEEDMLLKQNGVFDTAVQARFLELSNVAAYFRMKIASSPSGKVEEKDQSKPPVDTAPAQAPQ